MKIIKNLIGEKFGDLVSTGNFIYKESGLKKVNKRYEEVVCKCGKVYYSRREHLMGGRINNCGCNKIEQFRALGKLQKKHGMEGTGIYSVYYGIVGRCRNLYNHSYKNYGGRGIKCEWNSFEDFYNDMGSTYKSGLSIERTDVNGNYSKDNCTWITMKEQMYNKRNSIKIQIDGEILPLRMFCIKTNKRYDTVWRSIKFNGNNSKYLLGGKIIKGQSTTYSQEIE